MEPKTVQDATSAANADMFSTWVILAGLLVLAVIVGAGGMALMSINQQAQTPTGSQTTPTSR